MTADFSEGLRECDAGEDRKIIERWGSGEHSRGREGKAHEFSEGDGAEAAIGRRGAFRLATNEGKEFLDPRTEGQGALIECSSA